MKKKQAWFALSILIPCAVAAVWAPLDQSAWVLSQLMAVKVQQ